MADRHRGTYEDTKNEVYRRIAAGKGPVVTDDSEDDLDLTGLRPVSDAGGLYSGMGAIPFHGPTEAEKMASMLNMDIAGNPIPQKPIELTGNIAPTNAGPQPAMDASAGDVSGVGGGGRGGGKETAEVDVERGTPLSPQYHQLQQSANGAGQKQAESEKQALQQRGQLASMAGAINANYHLAAEAEIDRVNREREAHLASRRAKLEQMENDYQATTVDPERSWKNKGAGAKILSAIGLAFGSFASGYSGGKVPNFALQMLNAEAERDVEAQKAELEKRGRAVNQAQNYYEMALRETGDKVQATQLALAERKKAIANMVESAGAQIASGPEAQAKVSELQKKLYQDAADHQMKADLHEADKYREKLKDVTGGGGAGGAGGGDPYAGMTKAQRTKAQEADETIAAANRHADAMLQNPVINKTGSKLGAAGVISGTAIGDAALQRFAPDQARDVQELTNMNETMLAEVGKLSKDADGKLTAARQKHVEASFGLKSTDSPERRRQKIHGYKQFMNSVAEMEGAKKNVIRFQPQPTAQQSNKPSIDFKAE